MEQLQQMEEERMRKQQEESGQARPEEVKKTDRGFMTTALYVVAALAFILVGNLIL